MKDYSKFIPSSFGFITKYEIVGDNIHVYTPETQKGKPHIYPATKENIKFFESRFEKQYELIVKHRKDLEKYFFDKNMKKIMIPSIIIDVLLLLITSFLFTTSSALWIPAAILTATTMITSFSIISCKSKKYEGELDLIETYLKNKTDIEEMSKKDNNITMYLSKKTQNELDNNQKLQEENKIDDIYNITLLDNLLDSSNISGLKDLKEILLRYKTCKDLLKEQKFYIPKEEKSKKTTKTKKRVKSDEQR